MKSYHGWAIGVAAVFAPWALVSASGAAGAGGPESSPTAAYASSMRTRLNIDYGATRAFIQSAAQHNAIEMAAAQYAIANSQNPSVKQLARRVLSTASRSNDQLLNLASTYGIAMPTYPTSAELQRLQGLRNKRGAQFDAAYARFMANEYTPELERFVRAAGSSSIDPGASRYANSALPMMQDTLQRTNRLLASIERSDPAA